MSYQTPAQIDRAIQDLEAAIEELGEADETTDIHVAEALHKMRNARARLRSI